MNFDKWYFEAGYLGDDQNVRARIAYEAGQQSMQSEINELNDRINVALILLHGYQKSCTMRKSLLSTASEIRAITEINLHDFNMRKLQKTLKGELK